MLLSLPPSLKQGRYVPAHPQPLNLGRPVTPNPRPQKQGPSVTPKTEIRITPLSTQKVSPLAKSCKKFHPCPSEPATCGIISECSCSQATKYQPSHGQFKRFGTKHFSSKHFGVVIKLTPMKNNPTSFEYLGQNRFPRPLQGKFVAFLDPHPLLNLLHPPYKTLSLVCPACIVVVISFSFVSRIRLKRNLFKEKVVKTHRSESQSNARLSKFRSNSTFSEYLSNPRFNEFKSNPKFSKSQSNPRFGESPNLYASESELNPRLNEYQSNLGFALLAPCISSCCPPCYIDIACQTGRFISVPKYNRKRIVRYSYLRKTSIVILCNSNVICRLKFRLFISECTSSCRKLIGNILFVILNFFSSWLLFCCYCLHLCRCLQNDILLQIFRKRLQNQNRFRFKSCLSRLGLGVFETLRYILLWIYMTSAYARLFYRNVSNTVRLLLNRECSLDSVSTKIMNLCQIIKCDICTFMHCTINSRYFNLYHRLTLIVLCVQQKERQVQQAAVSVVIVHVRCDGVLHHCSFGTVFSITNKNFSCDDIFLVYLLSARYLSSFIAKGVLNVPYNAFCANLLLNERRKIVVPSFVSVKSRGFSKAGEFSLVMNETSSINSCYFSILEILRSRGFILENKSCTEKTDSVLIHSSSKADKSCHCPILNRRSLDCRTQGLTVNGNGMCEAEHVLSSSTRLPRHIHHICFSRENADSVLKTYSTLGKLSKLFISRNSLLVYFNQTYVFSCHLSEYFTQSSLRKHYYYLSFSCVIDVVVFSLTIRIS